MHEVIPAGISKKQRQKLHLDTFFHVADQASCAYHEGSHAHGPYLVHHSICLDAHDVMMVTSSIEARAGC